MAKFVAGNELNLEIERVMERAEKRIVLISPYIKLHDRYARVLRSKIDNPQVEIIIVFGKNEEQMQKSMQYADFAFFKELPNVEIRYEKSLHAKYYANEKSAVLTSMNLYSYSQDNNIEAGIITTNSITTVATNLVVGGLVDDVDQDAWKYFARVVNQSKLLYEKKPVFEDKLFGLQKKYKESVVNKDTLSEFFEKLNPSKVIAKKEKYMGFCIRTGVEIPFNVDKPYCDSAWKSWSRYQNESFAEGYCHFTGEVSNGETCKAKPILYKNWKNAYGHLNATMASM